MYFIDQKPKNIYVYYLNKKVKKKMLKWIFIYVFPKGWYISQISVGELINGI